MARSKTVKAAEAPLTEAEIAAMADAGGTDAQPETSEPVETNAPAPAAVSEELKEAVDDFAEEMLPNGRRKHQPTTFSSTLGAWPEEGANIASARMDNLLDVQMRLWLLEQAVFSEPKPYKRQDGELCCSTCHAALRLSACPHHPRTYRASAAITAG